MSLDRRSFLKGAAATAGACAAIAATAPEAKAAREPKQLPPKAVGLLYDSTLCIGCKACVAACRDNNNTPLENNTSEQLNLWHSPVDTTEKSFSVIKVYTQGSADVKDREQNGFAFLKKNCYHCVDPSCVSACPVSAMQKNPETGIVTYDKDRCIGCRYCVAACPFGIPKFEYDTATPEIKKCELCKHVLAKGGIPGCADRCPTGATLYGPVEALKAEAKRRLSLKAGDEAKFERMQVGSGDVQIRKVAKYVSHLYGEKELNGTQMLLLSGVPFEKLGMPTLPDEPFAAKSEGLQKTLYSYMAAPIALLGVLSGVVYKNTRGNEEK